MPNSAAKALRMHAPGSSCGDSDSDHAFFARMMDAFQEAWLHPAIWSWSSPSGSIIRKSSVMFGKLIERGVAGLLLVGRVEDTAF